MCKSFKHELLPPYAPNEEAAAAAFLAGVMQKTSYFILCFYSLANNDL